MTQLVIGGLDLSYTSTGMAVAQAGRVRTKAFQPKSRGFTRIDAIMADVLETLGHCDVIVCEGLITHAKGSSLTDMAGLWWIVNRELWREQLPVAVVMPPTLKKYATSRGTADKLAVFAAAMKRFPNLEMVTSDQADALWLAQAGCDHYGQTLVPMPAEQRAVLHSTVTRGRRNGKPVIDWPVLAKKEVHDHA